MSEHMGISGYVDYYHLPMDDEGGFTYCRRCKQTCKRVKVEFHQGFSGNWIEVICSKCKKVIWVASLDGRQKYIKDDKKCVICKKPTNHYDCFCSGGNLGGKYCYWCSKRCYAKQEIIDRKVQDG